MDGGFWPLSEAVSQSAFCPKRLCTNSSAHVSKSWQISFVCLWLSYGLCSNYVIILINQRQKKIKNSQFSTTVLWLSKRNKINKIELAREKIRSPFYTENIFESGGIRQKVHSTFVLHRVFGGSECGCVP